MSGFLAHLGSKKEDDVDRSGDIRSLFEKIRYFIRELPPWFRPYGFDFKKNSLFMRLINPYNENTLTGESANRDFGRSGRYKVVVLDEFAAMEWAEDAWTATGDSTPCRLAISTPKGTGNKFWKLRFKSKIDVFTAHWTIHPEKSIGAYRKDTGEKVDFVQAFNLWKERVPVLSPWYEDEIRRRSLDGGGSNIDIAQELDIDYITSGSPYFDNASVNKQKEWQITKDLNKVGNGSLIIGTLSDIDGGVEFRQSDNGWLRLYEFPKKEGQYVGGIDPAEGLNSSDFSSASFRCKKTRNLVAAIYGKFDYDELSYNANLVSKYFNDCLLCAESGGYGAAVNKRLYDLGANVARNVDFKEGNEEENDRLGFAMTSVSRPKMLADLEAEVREKAVELRDKDLKNEMLNFIIKDGKPQAAEGSNDDFIFSFGIAGQLLRFFPFSSVTEKSILQGDKISSKFIPRKNMGFSFKKD